MYKSAGSSVEIYNNFYDENGVVNTVIYLLIITLITYYVKN